ncbi:unnamed protein product [Urochloa humidicola]
MAPLAPCESGDPGSGALAAGAGTTPTTTAAGDARPPPSTRSGQQLAPTVAAGTSARPGNSFHELLLRDLYTTITPGFFHAPIPASIWITPPCLAPRFNASYVTSMLSYFFTAPPEVFRAHLVRSAVFCARVPSQNVANYLVVRGYIEFNHLLFCLHGSEAHASAMAAKLREEEGAFNATSSTATCSSVTSAWPRTARVHLPEVDKLDTSVNATNMGEEILKDLAFTTPYRAELPPVTQHVACSATAEGSGLSAGHAFTPAITAETKPYLRAALSPARPFTPTPRRMAPIPSNHNRCFRCLSHDHFVKDCRDPVRCRTCRGSGHRSYQCPMVLPREATPHPRRQRTPTLLRAADVLAVPFAPRPTPTASATPTPPPTPLTIPPGTAAFDPLHMLASTSAGPSIAQQLMPATTPPAEEDGTYYLGDLFQEKEDKGKGVLGPRPTAKPCLTPKAKGIKMVGAAALPPRRASAAPATVETVRSTLSPPSPASPVSAPPLAEGEAAPAAVMPIDAADAHDEDDSADSEEEISVDSDDVADGPEYVEVWVAEGDWAQAARFAYVEIEPVTAAANLAPAIRGALLRAAPHLRYRILPSAHGVTLLHFDSAVARENAMALQPFQYHGAWIELERIENTDDRFVREPAWLALVVCWNFPEEHWDAECVCALYRCLGTVREIDPECIPGSDRSCLRFVVELQHPHVPYRVGVHPPSGRGIVLRQQPVRFWPRAEQLDGDRNWISFFGPLPPPADGPDDEQMDGHAPPPPQGPFGPAAPPNPPAQAPHPPILLGAFFGAAILYHGFLNSYPLPRLPPLPLVIQLPTVAPAPRHAHIHPMLLLTWHPHAAPAPQMTPPPPPPPSPASTDPPEPEIPADAAIPPPPQRTRAPRAPRQRATVVAMRNSKRLAAKEDGKFLSATDKASQLRALHDSLALCSKPVQKLVAKKKLFKKTTKPIADADLSKIATVVGLGKAAADALDHVLSVGAAAGRELDLALAGTK